MSLTSVDGSSNDSTFLSSLLQITADYKGTGFTLANGNFDGAGITWGIVGFTLSNGELSTMLRDVDQQFSTGLQ